jgi:hypothetical protein
MLFPLAFDDFVYQNPGIGLAMPRLLSIANFGLVSKYDDLFSLGLTQTRPHNLSPLYDRVSHKSAFVPSDKQHPVELDCVALRHIETLDFYCLFRGYLILLAAHFDDSVNLLTSITEQGILAP